MFLVQNKKFHDPNFDTSTLHLYFMMLGGCYTSKTLSDIRLHKSTNSENFDVAGFPYFDIN